MGRGGVSETPPRPLWMQKNDRRVKRCYRLVLAALAPGCHMLLMRAAVRMIVGAGAVLMRGGAVAMSGSGVGLSRLVLARLVVMRRLTMVMRRRLM